MAVLETCTLTQSDLGDRNVEMNAQGDTTRTHILAYVYGMSVLGSQWWERTFGRTYFTVSNQKDWLS